MPTDVEKLLQQIRSLPADDQRRVRVALSAQPSTATRPLPSTAELTDGDYQQRLFEAGLLSAVRPRRRDQRAFESFTPLDIPGKPLSEAIIEERR